MSFQFTTKAGKTFEKPQTGQYLGLLADIVDLGEVATTFNGVTKTQPMTRFIWVLNANGTDGKPLSVTQRFNNNLHEKSNLYKTVKQILNAAPPLTLDPETLIGSVRNLFIQREITGEGQQQKDFANVLGISPAAPGATVALPADFVRDKNKPVADQARNKKKGTPVQAKPVQQPTQPAAQPVQSTQPNLSNPADIAAQLALLQQQLARVTNAAPVQGADVQF
jgi:hypothetical protein